MPATLRISRITHIFTPLEPSKSGRTIGQLVDAQIEVELASRLAIDAPYDESRLHAIKIFLEDADFTEIAESYRGKNAKRGP